MIEIRRMLINEDELKQLIVRLITAEDENDGNLPGMVMDLKITQDAPLTMQVHAQTATGHQVAKKMGEVEIMTAIIDYCLAKRIPMSRKSKKSIKRTKDGVALDMVIARI